MKVKNVILAIMMMLLGVSYTKAQEWQPPVKVNEAHRTQVQAIGKTPDGTSMTLLSVQCHPGKKGYIGFFYGVRDADKIKGFNFTDFEGPYAPASTKKLVTAIARTPKGNITVKTSVSGGRTIGSDPDAFEFRFGANINSNGEVMRLAKALARGISTLSITVQDYKDNKKILYTEFPTTNASTTVGQILKGCGVKSR
jgi:hypothetical protein